jgi:hypothetical protein
MISLKEQKLWQEMADLTFAKCQEHCHDLGSCCSEGDCESAKNYARQQGEMLLPVLDSNIPFLKDGKCTVPPHLRPCCSLHQCKIASLGFDIKDPAWTKKYFELREQLNKMAEKREKDLV